MRKELAKRVAELAGKVRPPGPCTRGLAVSFDGREADGAAFDCPACRRRHPPGVRVAFEVVTAADLAGERNGR